MPLFRDGYELSKTTTSRSLCPASSDLTSSLVVARKDRRCSYDGLSPWFLCPICMNSFFLKRCSATDVFMPTRSSRSIPCIPLKLKLCASSILSTGENCGAEVLGRKGSSRKSEGSFYVRLHCLRSHQLSQHHILQKLLKTGSNLRPNALWKHSV